MIEELASHIPTQLTNVSGRVFHSGRDAFQSGRIAYSWLTTPGETRTLLVADTVQSHTKTVLEDHPSNWSAYRDDKLDQREKLATARHCHLSTDHPTTDAIA